MLIAADGTVWTYADLLETSAVGVGRLGGALWMRQMVLGPAPEFCIQAPVSCGVGAMIEVLNLQLHPIYPES